MSIISHYVKLLRSDVQLPPDEREKMAQVVEAQERFLLERTAALQRIRQIVAAPGGTDLVTRLPALVRDRIAPATRWISVDEGLPEERAQPYQVIVTCAKRHDGGSMYEGEGQRRFLQDWVVRRWPKNFTH